MPHPSEHSLVDRPLGAREADELAETLKAVASELSVSATSHHLRLLRALRLARARREGRHVFYALHDHHLADLLAAVRHHHEHVHPPAPTPLPAPVEEELG